MSETKQKQFGVENAEKWLAAMQTFESLIQRLFHDSGNIMVTISP
jgi:hypothetical protein